MPAGAGAGAGAGTRKAIKLNRATTYTVVV